MKDMPTTMPTCPAFNQLEMPLRKRSLSTCPAYSIDEMVDSYKAIKHIEQALLRVPPSIRSAVNHSSCHPVGALSYASLASHLVSLRLSYITKLCRPPLTKLLHHPKNANNAFNFPVDPIKHGVLDYLEIIKQPMDLGTIKQKLHHHLYQSIEACFEDIRLVFRNAITYHAEGSAFHALGKQLLAEFEADVSSIKEKYWKEHEKKNTHKCQQCSGSLCLLCGEKCLKFESPELICHNPTCNQKIKRGNTYHISEDGNVVWCSKCFAASGPKKQGFLKRKFEEESAESFVECKGCKYMFHQACALHSDFSSGQIFCPLCVLENASSLNDPPVSRVDDVSILWNARTLPESKLSKFLEYFVKKLLTSSGHSDWCNSITIRVTSNYDRTYLVPDAIRQNFKAEGGFQVSQQLQFRQKCIQLFQNIDGIDVFLFCLYVQEFDQRNSPPNQSVVYIAYLDSVDYFRPMSMRQRVYHEIVISYLRYAAIRGYQRCFLWSCPPQRGDNFIFWQHPPQQKTPTRDRLNHWYSSIMQRALELKVVAKVEKLWDVFFSLQQQRKPLKNSREAAKKSFVGSGRAAVKKVKWMNNNNNNSNSNESSETVSKEENSDTLGYFAFNCPPIFEGDYWVMEFLRMHSSHQQRCQQEYKSRHSTNSRWCKDTLKGLQVKPQSFAFRKPVDTMKLKIPHYKNIIKHPMDLSTIENKLKKGNYRDIYEFSEDVRLIFNNAMLFNPASHPIYLYAKSLLQDFEKSLRAFVEETRGKLAMIDASVSDKQLLLTCYMTEQGKIEKDKEKEKDKENEYSCASTSFCSSANATPFILPTTSSFPSNPSTPFKPQSSDDMDLDNDSIDLLTKNSRHPSHCTSNTETTVEGFDTDDSMPFKRRRRSSSDSFSSIDSSEDFDSHNHSHREHFLQPINNNNNANTNNKNSNSNSSDRLFSVRHEVFKQPVLPKEVIETLLTDLSKAVKRLNDDLFVIKLSDNRQELCSLLDADALESFPELKQLLLSEDNADDRGIIEEDDDELIQSPLMDSRHTFLEHSQYRHFEFDTLRKAKYSSLNILYYLHRPQEKKCRPLCAHCHESIRELRWHCGGCASYDLCSPCKSKITVREENNNNSNNSHNQLVETTTSHNNNNNSNNSNNHNHYKNDLEGNSSHTHIHCLTPYRVTFM